MSFEAELAERDRVHALIVDAARARSVEPYDIPLRADDRGFEALWIDVQGFPPNFTYALLYRERSDTRMVLQAASADAFVASVMGEWRQ